MTAAVDPAPAAEQCRACRYWQPRGGLIAAAQMSCVALEEEQTERLARVVSGVLLHLARQGACPAAEPYPDYPDAYLSQDLPPGE
jgi:hypothetical protein